MKITYIIGVILLIVIIVGVIVYFDKKNKEQLALNQLYGGQLGMIGQTNIQGGWFNTLMGTVTDITEDATVITGQATSAL